LALFVKDVDEDLPGHGIEPQSVQPFQIIPTRDLQADWREVITEAYQTTSVLHELESKSWWSDAWVIIVPKSQGGRPAGVLVARSVTYQLRPSIENHVMAVAPRWQGTGIAKRLLSGLVTLARELNLSSAISYVDVANRNAMRAHQASGFLKLSEDSVYVFYGE
jgi:GNAT superfamily N-acetyltransferase